MTTARTAVSRVRWEQKEFWRNPAAAAFTFAFPLMFLVIFTALLGGGQIQLPKAPDFELDLTTYYVGAMATFGVISACFTNIAIQTSFSRDQGLLKRLRGTPLPAWAYLAARVVHAMAVGATLVVITLVFGLLVYDAPLPTGTPLLEFIVTFLVGSLAFAALALALTAVIPNADAAPPIVNATILPLLFLSGIFIPLDKDAPAWISTVADIFPVKHFADAMRSSYLGNVTARTPLGSFHPFTFDWMDVAIIAAWGVVGLILAGRFFSWEPRR
jgi:ABC-2 type transport system permease protein